MASSSDLVQGGDAFETHQKSLRGRLDALIRERAALLTPETPQPYRIGRGDIIKVDVFGFSEMSGESEVNEVGNLVLPLIGAVPAEGKTVAELQEEVRIQSLRFIRQPNVRLHVNAYNSQRVSVVGSVVKPGWFPLKRPGYSLNELISEIGGLKDNAGGRLYLIPAGASESSVSGQALTSPTLPTRARSAGVEIDIEELVGTLDKAPLSIPLVNGDTIIVPEAGQFRVDGEVEHPGTFTVSRRTTSLAAIAAAGGLTYAANVNKVELLREIGNGKKASKTIDLEQVAFGGASDVSIRDGDVIIVPSAPVRFQTREVVEGIRSLLRGSLRLQQ